MCCWNTASLNGQSLMPFYCKMLAQLSQLAFFFCKKSSRISCHHNFILVSAFFLPNVFHLHRDQISPYLNTCHSEVKQDQQISWSKAGWTCSFNQNKQSKTTNKHCLALLKESLDLRALITQKLSGPPTFCWKMFPGVTWLAEKAPAAELCSLLNPLSWILITREEGRLVTQRCGSVQEMEQTHRQLFNYTNL